MKSPISPCPLVNVSLKLETVTYYVHLKCMNCWYVCGSVSLKALFLTSVCVCSWECGAEVYSMTLKYEKHILILFTMPCVHKGRAFPSRVIRTGLGSWCLPSYTSRRMREHPTPFPFTVPVREGGDRVTDSPFDKRKKNGFRNLYPTEKETIGSLEAPPIFPWFAALVGSSTFCSEKPPRFGGLCMSS